MWEKNEEKLGNMSLHIQREFVIEKAITCVSFTQWRASLWLLKERRCTRASMYKLSIGEVVKAPTAIQSPWWWIVLSSSRVFWVFHVWSSHDQVLINCCYWWFFSRVWPLLFLVLIPHIMSYLSKSPIKINGLGSCFF